MVQSYVKRSFIGKVLHYLFILSIFLTVCCSLAYAHSPSSMTAEYNSVTEQLTVEINHQVSNPNTHYVNNIVVTLNGETEVDQSYSSQPDSSFTYTFEDIYAEEGDQIEVTANCNQGGLITDQLTVGSDTTSDSDDDSSTPGFELILVFASVISVFFIYRRKRGFNE